MAWALTSFKRANASLTKPLLFRTSDTELRLYDTLHAFVSWQGRTSLRATLYSNCPVFFSPGLRIQSEEMAASLEL